MEAESLPGERDDADEKGPFDPTEDAAFRLPRYAASIQLTHLHDASNLSRHLHRSLFNRPVISLIILNCCWKNFFKQL
ncbi:MAG: hypothetical protein HRU69_03085 [Flammeovirgaceae bacterium]|nr:MAG: hypothetical protein HRU69_03085 [Flammeovirgaceae bacterium]